jgi:hypothetical protein
MFALFHTFDHRNPNLFWRSSLEEMILYLIFNIHDIKKKRKIKLN